MVIIILLAGIGFAVSLYGFFVERWLKSNPTYKPVCDLSDRISCSKPLFSSYSKIFGVSNTILGMAYYIVIALAALLGYNHLVLFFSVLAAVSSLGFAYILYFKIRSLCLICTTTYLINIALFLVAFWYR